MVQTAKVTPRTTLEGAACACAPPYLSSNYPTNACEEIATACAKFKMCRSAFPCGHDRWQLSRRIQAVIATGT